MNMAEINTRGLRGYRLVSLQHTFSSLEELQGPRQSLVNVKSHWDHERKIHALNFIKIFTEINKKKK